MLPSNVTLPPLNTRKNLKRSMTSVDPLIKQLMKFRIDGQTINARNVDELYPGLDRLVIRSLQSGDCRQLNNRLKRHLKAEYLLITSKHIHLSVCSKTEHILERLVELGATLDLHFYEPIHMKELELMCRYGFDINERLEKYNNQTALSILINKSYSLSMLEVLIRNGARFDVQDNQGHTALHHLCLSNVSDEIFDFIIEKVPASCLNITNQTGGTALDLVYLSTYEQPTTARLRRLHVLLCRKDSKLTRYGMREPNLVSRKQYSLSDILSCKEFLLKYSLKHLFDITVKPMAWSLFLFYDVLRSCEHRSTSRSNISPVIQQRLEHYLLSLMENGEIPLDYLFHRTNLNDEDEQRYLNDVEKSLSTMTSMKIKLSELRLRHFKLKSLCRIKIKSEIRNYPNDVLQLRNLSKILQAYLTYYNPFIKADPHEKIVIPTQ